MDLLKAEIERKKRAATAAKQSAAASGAAVAVGSSRAYLKASDLRRLQEEKEKEAAAAAEQARRGTNNKKRRRTDGDGSGDGRIKGDGASTATAGTGVSGGREDKDERNKKAKNDDDDSSQPSTTPGGDAEAADAESKRQPKHDPLGEQLSGLTPADVTARLRSLGLPVRLFGERTVTTKLPDEEETYDDAQRIGRLREALERRQKAMAGLSEMDEFRLGSGHGIRNPFLDRRGGGADVLGTGGGGAAAAAGTGLMSDKSSGAGGKKSGGEDGGGAGENRKGKDGVGEDGDNQGEEDDEDDPHKKIHKFFKSLLRQWEDDLAHRPESIKHTAAGRNEIKTYKQCKDYIRPLFKMCKSRRLEPGMMAHILNIVTCCEQGEFVKANDAYIDVAIGRAAWPIGVTMVGIHARSGREKIGSSNVAHVMNNELQRKYLTSVKRLMSYCQKKRTDVDPSKKVVNM
jgi:pre-mRNA-splicing factor 18